MFYPFKQLMILALLVLAGCAAQPVVKVPQQNGDRFIFGLLKKINLPF